jgi:BarA-like signal transduction histidine kinase
MDNWRSLISSTLEQAGFEVTFAGDIPEEMNVYDLVVIEAS